MYLTKALPGCHELVAYGVMTNDTSIAWRPQLRTVHYPTELSAIALQCNGYIVCNAYLCPAASCMHMILCMGPVMCACPSTPGSSKHLRSACSFCSVTVGFYHQLSPTFSKDRKYASVAHWVIAAAQLRSWAPPARYSPDCAQCRA